MKTYKEFMEDKCNLKGEQKEVFLTQEETKVKLLKRVTSGEINISPSDKGKRVVVMPLEMYR